MCFRFWTSSDTLANARTDLRNLSVVCAWYDWCQWNPLANILRLAESAYGGGTRKVFLQRVTNSFYGWDAVAVVWMLMVMAYIGQSDCIQKRRVDGSGSTMCKTWDGYFLRWPKTQRLIYCEICFVFRFSFVNKVHLVIVWRVCWWYGSLCYHDWKAKILCDIVTYLYCLKIILAVKGNLLKNTEILICAN